MIEQPLCYLGRFMAVLSQIQDPKDEYILNGFKHYLIGILMFDRNVVFTQNQFDLKILNYLLILGSRLFF